MPANVGRFMREVHEAAGCCDARGIGDEFCHAAIDAALRAAFEAGVKEGCIAGEVGMSVLPDWLPAAEKESVDER